MSKLLLFPIALIGDIWKAGSGILYTQVSSLDSNGYAKFSYPMPGNQIATTKFPLNELHKLTKDKYWKKL